MEGGWEAGGSLYVNLSILSSVLYRPASVAESHNHLAGFRGVLQARLSPGSASDNPPHPLLTGRRLEGSVRSVCLQGSFLLQFQSGEKLKKDADSSKKRRSLYITFARLFLFFGGCLGCSF